MATIDGVGTTHSPCAYEATASDERKPERLQGHAPTGGGQAHGWSLISGS